MTYFIVVDKPKSWTSHRVVHNIKKNLNQKVGHTGTLDPFATGVLPIAVGRATKLIPYLDERQKIYRATLELGTKTDTADIDGQIVEEQSVPKFTIEKITSIFEDMLGVQEQEVPKYSAVKVDGKRLYKYAREGQTVVLPKKEITIERMKLLACETTSIDFEVHCSKGTYVRALGEEIAKKIGTVGHLSQLERISSGLFHQNHAICNFSQLIETSSKEEIFDIIQENIVDIRVLFPFSYLDVEDSWLSKISNGQRLPLSMLPPLEIGEKLLVMNKNNICALCQREESSLRYLSVLL